MRFPLAGAPFMTISFALVWSLGQLSAADTSTQTFERLLVKSNPPAPPPYRAFRRLEGGVTGGDRQGWLEAWTEFSPSRGFTYEVVGEGGSEYIRNKVLRGMLKTEQELLARGRRLRASLEAKNYEFVDGGADDNGLQRIVMKPVKKSDGIVNGTLLFDPAAGLMTQIRGRLVKSPSFWIRDVDVTWRFAHVHGHIVPVEMLSSGRVRMFGRSNFKMSYDYESIDGRRVKSETDGSSSPRTRGF